MKKIKLKGFKKFSNLLFRQAQSLFSYRHTPLWRVTMSALITDPIQLHIRRVDGRPG